MATSIKQAVAEVKNAYNIVDVIGSYGVQLKHKGTTWVGLCPFHNEKTPSFSVSEKFQNYKCWGCGASGDLLSFIERNENIPFYDTLIKLAEDKNIELDLDIKDKETIDYQSVREALRETANFFFQEFKKLPEDHAAKQQILSRGLTINKMLYGYAPEGRDTLYKFLKSKGFTDEVILYTGTVKHSEKNDKFYDFWNGRLMFFLTDLFNRPIGFSGRKLFETDSRGKYVNSSDGPLFDKSSVLFNSAKAKKEASDESLIFVTEGQFDVSAYVEAGITNVVASSGTAFTSNHAKIIDRLVGANGKIVFSFDGDAAGIKAIKQIFKNIPFIQSKAFVLIFPESMDPCDYRLKVGNEDFVKFVKNNQTPLIDFILNEEVKKFDLSDSIENSNFVNSAAQIVKTIQNHALREKYIKRISLDSFTSVDTVKEIVDKADSLSNDSLEETAVKDDVVEEKREYLEDEVEESITVEELKNLMKKDAKYSISVNLLKLTLSEPNFMEDFKNIAPIIPSKLSSVVNDLNSLDLNSNIVPELFTNSSVVDYIVTSALNKHENKMTVDDRKDLFDYLSKELKNIYNKAANQQVRQKVFSVLEGSTKTGASMLAKALETEEKGLQSIKILK